MSTDSRNHTSRKQTAISFLSLVTSGQVLQAYERHIAPEFRHHNRYFKGDAQSLMHGMGEKFRGIPHRPQYREACIEYPGRPPYAVPTRMSPSEVPS